MWLNLEGKSEKKNPCFLASLSKHNLHLGVPLSLVLLLYEEPDWSGFVRHYGLRFIPGTPKIFAELCWYMLHILWPFLRFRWAHLNCVETYMHTCDTGNGVSFVGSLLSCEKLWSVDCSISVWWSMVWCGVVCSICIIAQGAVSCPRFLLNSGAHARTMWYTRALWDTFFGKSCITTLWHLPARPCSHKHIFWHNYRITFRLNLNNALFLATVCNVSQMLS